MMWVVKGLFTICVFNVWLTCSAHVQAETLEQAVNAFSVDLLKELSGEEPENLVVSPVSVSILLAILQQGARHNSSSQLTSVLHLPEPEARVAYAHLSRRLQESNSSVAVLELANRLFLGQGYELQEEFRNVAEHEFKSGVEQVAFGAGEGATAINDWVSRSTHGRIPSIVGPRLDIATVLVLANAIFFKSPWQNRFNTYFTVNQTFSSRPGHDVTVPMMHHNSELFWAGTDEERDLKWVKLPFEDVNYSMVIVVPNKKYGLADLLRNFTGETLSHLLEAGSLRDVDLRVPRFKISSEIHLEEPLQELGVRDIFDSRASDLSGITASSQHLYVSKALQKADIEVDEEGATAAAATVIQMVNMSARLPFNTLEITADHPFLAVIFEGTDKIPLFVTTVVDPSSA